MKIPTEVWPYVPGGPVEVEHAVQEYILPQDFHDSEIATLKYQVERLVELKIKLLENLIRKGVLTDHEVSEILELVSI